MMTLSVVIPAWSGTPELAEMLDALCLKVRPMCDELIVTEDAWEYSRKIEIADVYLTHSRLGHAKNLRLGFEAATQEFVALMDSDIYIESGSLRDLCVSETIVYPTWINWFEYLCPTTGEELWFIVAPRKFIQECPPTSGSRLEGIDEWENVLRGRFPILKSDKVTYRHSGLTSYGRARIPS